MEAGTARWESHAAGSRRGLDAGTARPEEYAGAGSARRLHFLVICGIIADIPFFVLKPFRRTAGAFPEQPKG